MVERITRTAIPQEQVDNRFSRDVFVGKMREQVGTRHSLKYHPILTKTQEQMLFRELRAGNSSTSSFMQTSQFPQFSEEMSERDGEKWAYVLATNTKLTGIIAACNYRLVVSQAKRYMGNGILSFEDILGGGINGLLRAIEKFDPDKEGKFSTYAKWHITKGIQKTIREHNGISQRVQVGIGKTRQIQDAFNAVFRREPTQKELRQQLLAHTDYSQARIDEVLDRRHSTSLDGDIYPATVLHDTGVDVAETVSTHDEQQGRSVAIGGAIERQLESDEKDIIARVYVEGMNEEQAIEDIAGERNISKNEARMLFNAALNKLSGDQQIQALRQVAVADPEGKRRLSQHGVVFEGEPREQIPQFDADVPLSEKIKLLRLQSYTKTQIVEILGITLANVGFFVEKLISDGEIPAVHEARKQQRTAAQSEATDAVGNYMKEHPPLFLGRPVRKKKRQPEEMEKMEKSELIPIDIDKEVKALRENTDLTYQQIANKLGITPVRARFAGRKLIALGEISARGHNKRYPEIIEFDNKVKDLKENTNLTRVQIADRLGVSFRRVVRSLERLHASGEIIPTSYTLRNK